MNAVIEERVLIRASGNIAEFAVATRERHPLSVRTSLTYEAHMTEWTTDRKHAEAVASLLEKVGAAC